MPKPDWAATSAHARNKNGPKLGEHVQLLRMMLARNMGSSSEKYKVEASITLCFACAGYLVPRDVLPPFHNIAVRTVRCNQQILLFRPYFLRTELFVGHRGGGGGVPKIAIQFQAPLINFIFSLGKIF